MKQLLPNDNRIAIYGKKQQVEQAQIILIKNIPDISTLSESQARLQLQETIDYENIKADILFNGNSVWSKIRILKDIKTVKKYGMKKLTNYLYQFLSLSCGSIAHYNKYGWIACYPTLHDLKQFFRRNEYGQRVLNYLPTWKTDAYKIVENIEMELGV